MSLDAILNNYTINYDPSPGGRETLKPFEQNKRTPAQFKYKRRAGESSEHVRILCLIFQIMMSCWYLNMIFQLIQSLNSAGTPADSIFKRGWVATDSPADSVFKQRRPFFSKPMENQWNSIVDAMMSYLYLHMIFKLMHGFWHYIIMMLSNFALAYQYSS